ncbi:MAG: thiamine-phosphate kinase, partial [Gemmatimonadetes bacterium]|nr:thiamine-phosphate kinase [Gemmatimonadota bacterium]
VTCDMAMEDVHFRRVWLDPGEVGWRAAAAALSDLAAMAARPVAALLSLAVAEADARSGLAAGVAAGVREACEAVGASVVGGDLTRSMGPLVLDVVVLGRAPRPLTRGGARPGDEVWVTGGLGAAAAAVVAWERGETPSAKLREAYARPRPRVEEAAWLAGAGGLHAGLDLSDGLGGDAGHVAAASGVAVRLEARRVPVAGGVRGVAGSDEDALGLALSGGEDFELLLVAEPGVMETLSAPFEARFAIPLTRVGDVFEGEGVHLDRGDGTGAVPLARGGFSHFAPAGEGER